MLEIINDDSCVVKAIKEILYHRYKGGMDEINVFENPTQHPMIVIKKFDVIMHISREDWWSFQAGCIISIYVVNIICVELFYIVHAELQIHQHQEHRLLQHIIN